MYTRNVPVFVNVQNASPQRIIQSQGVKMQSGILPVIHQLMFKIGVQLSIPGKKTDAIIQSGGILIYC